MCHAFGVRFAFSRIHYVCRVQKITILIAEDDADDRFLLQAAFAECQFADQIDFVENGVELLEHLRSLKRPQSLPSFVLLDLNMPKKDGREALKEMKEDPELKKLPVVVFTTTRNENEIRRCYELGANSYVVKPSTFDHLVDVVRRVRNYWADVACTPH